MYSYYFQHKMNNFYLQHILKIHNLIFGNTIYLLGKHVSRRIHVDLTRENTWGGLPLKQCSNVMDKVDHQFILKF
jgi:hypothetical protein